MKLTIKLDENADTSGSYCIGSVRIAPNDLILRFGPPNDKNTDTGSSSGGYVFSDNCGRVFTLYESKQTTLSDYPDNPTPERFWKSRVKKRFHVGISKKNGNKYVSHFQDFLNARILLVDQELLDLDWESVLNDSRRPELHLV